MKGAESSKNAEKAASGVPGGNGSPPSEGAGVRELEERVRSLERSLQLALAELTRIKGSRWWRLASRCGRLRASVALLIHGVRHPVDALRPVLIRRLPAPVRTALVNLLRRPTGSAAPAVAQTSEPASLPTAPRPRPAVLFLPAGGWSSRGQRPQQLAAHLARRGWEVWYAGLEPAPGERTAVEGAALAPGVRGLGLPTRRPVDLHRERLGPGAIRRIVRALASWQVHHRYHDVVVLCELPAWHGLAVRLRQELGWPLVHDELHPQRGSDHRPDVDTLERMIVGSFPLVSVIVVTYQNLTLTRLCLESVLCDTAYPNLEVVVVDNASTDGTPAYLQELAAEHPNVRFVRNSTNRGFAAACNQGARFAQGQVLCFLNNDTVVSRGWLSALVRALDADPWLGLVGAVTNDIGNEARIAVGYSSLEEMPDWAERWSWSHRGKRQVVPMVALFCAALRREVWEEVGELDERFTIGMFEDDDYSLRIRRAGYHIAIARDAFVHHWHRAAFRLLGDRGSSELYERNRRLFRAKWSRSRRARTSRPSRK